ncbi:MAG: hypothetical protein E7527_04260 [Ruminococcaceae bacterium]|nr:hypothetical protein [Oscillospiraceae bacterium]
MNRPHREHPAVLPLRLSLYLWLFLLPLIRGVHLLGVPGDIPAWLKSHLPDRLVALLVIVTAVTLWWHRTYTLSRHSLVLRRGILWRRTTRIPLPLITTLTVERPLWLRLSGGARVVADTDAGHHRLADLTLLVTRRQSGIFLPDANRIRFRASGGRIFLLSVLSSDSLGGFLLLITVLRHGSILLGEGLQKTVFDNLQSAAEAQAVIPKTAAIVALALTAAWLTGTVRLFLRHLPFRVCRTADTLTVYTGFFTRRVHCCALGAVHYLDRRQTLSAYLLGLFTGYVSCTGYGKDRNTRAVLIPPCRPARLCLEERLFLPALAHHSLSIHPAKGALWRYWQGPLCLLGALPLGAFLGGYLFPHWRHLIAYLAAMAALPCLWLLLVRWADRRTAGLGCEAGCFCLSYSRFLTLHRVTLPRDKVALILTRQSLWQKRRGLCTIKIYSHHEFRRPHPVRHLPLDEVLRLLDRIN